MHTWHTYTRFYPYAYCHTNNIKLNESSSSKLRREHYCESTSGDRSLIFVRFVNKNTYESSKWISIYGNHKIPLHIYHRKNPDFSNTNNFFCWQLCTHTYSLLLTEYVRKWCRYINETMKQSIVIEYSSLSCKTALKIQHSFSRRNFHEINIIACCPLTDPKGHWVT